ncbi:MAG: hypothetical protein ACXW2C_05800 [Acidimicrobiia bacterium]
MTLVPGLDQPGERGALGIGRAHRCRLLDALGVSSQRSAARSGPLEPVPGGRNALRSLIGRLVDVGMSKFVIRPAAPVAEWRGERSWLADTLLDLQT